MSKDLILKQNQYGWFEDFWSKINDDHLDQKELANKVGITRPYLNQLLNRKRKLTPMMQQRIMIAYYEITGKNSLSICLDYIRIRFPTHDVYKIIDKLFGLKITHFWHDYVGRYGYTSRYAFGNMELFVSEEGDRRGTLLELKGKGCRQFERYSLGNQRDWYDFFDIAHNLQGVVKRIDIAINDYVNILPIHYYVEKCKKKEYVTKFKDCRYFVRDRDEIKGETIYFGSRKSAIHFCMYQKDVEQYFRLGKEITETSIKNRFEIRLADERAELAVEQLLSFRDPSYIAFGIINNYLRFVRPTTKKEKQGWETDYLWQQFIGKNLEKLSLTTYPEPITIEQSVQWITKQVAPTLKMILAIDSATAQDELMTIISQAKLNPKQEILVQQMIEESEEQHHNAENEK